MTDGLNANQQHILAMQAAHFAPTVLEEDHPPSSGSASVPLALTPHNTHSDSTIMPPALPGSAGALLLLPFAALPVEGPRPPFKDLRTYMSTAYLPPIPQTIRVHLEEHLEKLMNKRMNRGVVMRKEDVRNVRLRRNDGALWRHPMKGKRTLAEVEQIDLKAFKKATGACECLSSILSLGSLSSPPSHERRRRVSETL